MNLRCCDFCGGRIAPNTLHAVFAVPTQAARDASRNPNPMHEMFSPRAAQWENYDVCDGCADALLSGVALRRLQLRDACV
jgi:hypothetical protein